MLAQELVVTMMCSSEKRKKRGKGGSPLVFELSIFESCQIEIGENVRIS